MGHTIWMTGLSGAGKSTLAKALMTQLQQQGTRARIIDGDDLRTGLCANLGFSREDRRENVRRAAEACRLLNEAGVTVIAALVSPYREDRMRAGEIIGYHAFREVWISTSLTVCEQRDPKGLYHKARRHQIPGFTGISDPYERPLAPALKLDTAVLSVDRCVLRLAELLPRSGAENLSKRLAFVA